MRPALKRISRGFHVQWEISWFLLFLLGQFHGFTYQLIAQFHGIPLEKSQPTERTFAGQVTPSKRTFGGVSAPEKPTFRLILRHLTGHPRLSGRISGN
jgi:hypothetical protein